MSSKLNRLRQQRDDETASDDPALAEALPEAMQFKRSSAQILSQLTEPVGAIAATLPTIPSPNVQAVAEGKTYEFPLTQIRESRFNARVHYRIEELEAMSSSLSSAGQLVPARGFIKDGLVYLIDGQKRFRSAPAAGLVKFRVEICSEPESNISHYLQSREINEQRSEQTVLDDAVRFREFLADGVASTQESLAELMNMSQTRLTRIMSIGNVPDQVLRRMRETPSLTQFVAATSIAQLFSDRTRAEARAYVDRRSDQRTADELLSDLANDIVDVASREEMSANQVRVAVDKAIQLFRKESKTRPHASKAAFLFGSVKGELKTFEEAGRLDLSIAGLSREKLRDLQERIAALASSDVQPMGNSGQE